MAAAVLTLALAFIGGGSLWLVLGARLALVEEAELNDLLNLLVYVGAVLPPAFALVFFVLETL